MSVYPDKQASVLEMGTCDEMICDVFALVFGLRGRTAEVSEDPDSYLTWRCLGSSSVA